MYNLWDVLGDFGNMGIPPFMHLYVFVLYFKGDVLFQMDLLMVTCSGNF